MSNLEYIIKKFKKNETVYLINDLEDIAIKLVPGKDGYKTFAKWQGKSVKDEYEVANETNLSLNARIGGPIITKKEYEEY